MAPIMLNRRHDAGLSESVRKKAAYTWRRLRPADRFGMTARNASACLYDSVACRPIDR